MLRRKKRKTALRPGDRRLLHDLAVTRIAFDEDRVPAQKRLERELGADFARELRFSLTGSDAKAA